MRNCDDACERGRTLVILLARNWWALVLRGLFGVLFGFVAIAWPQISIAVLALLYGAYALVGGVFAVAAALIGTGNDVPWWALLVEGLLGITVGVITFLWPGLTAMALVLLIAAWAVAAGVFQIVAAVRLRKDIQGELVLAVSGILSALFGGTLAFFPALELRRSRG